MPSSFVRRRIVVTFKLGKGAFGQTGFDTVRLEERRVSALILKAGGASLGELHLRIWGMPLEQMNQLATLGMLAVALRNNQVQVEAGDDENGTSVVFDGTITNAWVDLSDPPDACFQVIAHAGMLAAIKPVPPRSYSGSVDVAVIMASLAAQMNLTFENSGVSVMLSNPYFPGTAREQARAAADAAGIEWLIDGTRLAIWRRGQPRRGLIPLISAETGMIKSPSFAANGIALLCLFNPNVAFGGAIQVDSVLPAARGQWVVYSLLYHLEAEIPGGNWLMRVLAAPPGFVPVVS